MTRRKRRKITGLLKCCILLVLPFGVCAGAKGTAVMREKMSGESSIIAGKTPSAKGRAELSKESTYSKERSAEVEDILSSEMILSEGYGFNAETETADVVKLKSPLEMIADNAGPKPYPTEGEWNEGGDIVRTTYGPYKGNSFFDLEGGGQVNNKTSISNDDLRRESACFADFKLSNTSEPQVLIYHTHTTESFEPYVREHYDASFNYRTTDETKNVVMVGDAIEAELESAGIGVIHVRTIHDYPSYNGAYGRSRESILPILEQYPSIKVVLDIHRDAIASETSAYQPYIEIGGKEAAQIMIISGCDDGTLDMPNYMKNFHFACRLQEKVESDNNGLTRPILFDYRHYNQDLTTGSLLIEVGSHGNTLEQVQYSGQLFGKSLAGLLNSIKEEE